jgi:Family of unknown function (DUF6247)
MSATWAIDDKADKRHPLARGARPVDIRAALRGEDQVEFDEALSAATDRFRESLDFSELFAVLDQWRKIAVLQSDPERFTRIARRAAELNTGRPPAPDASVAELRAQAGV